MQKLAWAALLVVVVSACGGTVTTAPSAAPATSAASAAATPGKAEVTKIVVAKSGTDDFTSVNQNYFYDALRAKGFTVEVQNLASADTSSSRASRM